MQEFVEGQNLAQALATQGALAQVEIKRLLHNLLPVLEFIHADGVIHRDIKPENIIRCPNGELVLVDFGAAKHATGTALLKIGTTIGSAEYIAPEQSRGKATFASDLYSLGVTCIYLLTQASPFDLIDGNNHWVWRDWLQNNPVSKELGYLLDKLIATAPNQRFQSATEVLDFLKHPKLPVPAAAAALSKPIDPQKVLPQKAFLPQSGQLQLGSKWRSLRKPLMMTAIAAFSMGAVSAAVTLPRFVSQANQAKQTEAKLYVSSIGRAEQAYFLEK